jgi:hypothetical protein
MNPSAPHDPAPRGRTSARDTYGRASDAWLGQLRVAAQEGDPAAWLGELRAAAQDDERVVAAPPRRVRRVATTAALVVLFALGAALTAGAGDRVAGAVAEEDATVLASATDETAATTEPAATEPVAVDEAAPAQVAPPAEPADEPAEPPAVAPETAAPPAGEPVNADAPADDGDAVDRGPAAPPAAVPAATAPTRPAARVHRRATAAPTPVRRPRHRVAAKPLVAPVPPRHRVRQLELESPAQASATVWLHAVLPDPTPPSRRLTAAFAEQLQATAKREHVDWAVLLGILRAKGELGSVPASAGELDALAAALARAKAQGAAPVLSVTGDTATADRAVALAHLNRAVGIGALVHGFEWAKERLGARLLADRRVTVYDGGRGDIEAGRIDVRVLALVGYLADAYGGVTVSCLESGHRLYARPGVISAHIYGLAADISAVGETPILGHQDPGGITEEAVRSILLLPAELRPRQVISLLGLGGPSFALADHYNHIHVGF